MCKRQNVYRIRYESRTISAEDIVLTDHKSGHRFMWELRSRFHFFSSVVQNASIRMIKLLPLANIMQPIWSLKLVRDGVFREFAKLNHYSRYLVTTHISIRDPWKFQYKTRFFMIYLESMYIFQDHVILSWEHCRPEIVLSYARTIAWLWYSRCPWSSTFKCWNNTQLNENVDAYLQSPWLRLEVWVYVAWHPLHMK